MSLQTRLSALITAIGADIKSLTGKVDNPPAVRVRRMNPQYFASGAFTTVLWDTEDYDTHGGYPLTTDDGYFIPIAGQYRVTASITLASTPGGRLIIRVLNNGNETYIGTCRPNGGIGNPNVNCTGTVSALVNDKIQVQMYQDTGGTWNTESPGWSPCFMEVRYERPL